MHRLHIKLFFSFMHVNIEEVEVSTYSVISASPAAKMFLVSKRVHQLHQQSYDNRPPPAEPATHRYTGQKQGSFSWWSKHVFPLNATKQLITKLNEREELKINPFTLLFSRWGHADWCLGLRCSTAWIVRVVCWFRWWGLGGRSLPWAHKTPSPQRDDENGLHGKIWRNQRKREGSEWELLFGSSNARSLEKE